MIHTLYSQYIILQNLILFLKQSVLCICLSLHIFLSLILQRWRKRWFALRHSGELPGQYFLEYYTDKRCRKLKGCIDLDQCEQVITILYYFSLAITTKKKNCDITKLQQHLIFIAG